MKPIQIEEHLDDAVVHGILNLTIDGFGAEAIEDEEGNVSVKGSDTICVTKKEYEVRKGKALLVVPNIGLPIELVAGDKMSLLQSKSGYGVGVRIEIGSIPKNVYGNTIQASCEFVGTLLSKG